MSQSINYLDSYYQLRSKIDKKADELNELHQIHMQCKKGCDSCCEAIRVFPVEFYAIEKELKARGLLLPKRKFNSLRKSCMFLINGACSIYDSRPFICRTQGLPLMYQSLKGDGYEVSHCQLNFKEVPITSFNVDNVLFMPDFNSKLFLLNQSFVKSNGLFKGDFKKRIALYKLMKHAELK